MAAHAGLTIETLFAPYEDTQARFLQFVGGARSAITILIYGFHLPPLTDLLISKAAAGVKVALILDHTQAEGKAEAGEVEKLIAAKIPLLIGTSEIHRQILHSKFCVVDRKTTEFGSWNYSLSASQQSNTMTFVTDRGYAREFLQHFDRVRAFILLNEMTLQPAGEVAPDQQ